MAISLATMLLVRYIFAEEGIVMTRKSVDSLPPPVCACSLLTAFAGMMSFVFTNSSPALPVWGGRSRLMGVSPSGQPFKKEVTRN